MAIVLFIAVFSDVLFFPGYSSVSSVLFFVIGLCSYLKLGSNEGVLFEINKEMWEGGFYLYPDVPDAGMARSRPVMG